MGSKPAVPVLIGPFPGAIHGVSIINARLRDMLSARGLAAECLDIAPALGTSGWLYHAIRSRRTLLGMMRMLNMALHGRPHRHVMSLDGGAGIVYNVALALVARITGQAMLFYHHSSRYVLADSALMKILMAVAGPVPQVFCSRNMAALFHARYQAAGAVLVINNAAWASGPVPRDARTGETLRLGFLSALTMEKGLGRAIETLRALRGQGVAAQLFLAGGVSNAVSHALLDAAQREFGPALVWQGILDGQDKADFFANLDYFLFPSLYPHETQSLVVPEALCAGVPVIAFDHRFVGEVVGEGGLLVPPAIAFSGAAAAWILAGQGDGNDRRVQARRQFERQHEQAVVQVERLIAWSLGDDLP